MHLSFGLLFLITEILGPIGTLSQKVAKPNVYKG